MYEEKSFWRKNMYLTDDKITEIILKYVTDNRASQAVLIDGEWGSGKTRFVNKKLIPALKNKVNLKKTIYVSLYGVNEVAQIMNEMYISIMEEFFNKKLKKKRGEKITKGINIISKLISTGMKYFNLDSKDLPKMNDFAEINNAIIIFDDLERCSIEINQLLGFINNLVEHNSIKVIIVANQAEINNTRTYNDLAQKYLVALTPNLTLDKSETLKDESNKNKNSLIDIETLQERTKSLFEKDIVYEKIKEKLIGLTIKYRAKFDDIYESVIDEYIKDTDLKKFMNSNKELVLSVFDDYSHFNIRTLIFAVVSYETIFNIVSEINFDNKELLDEQLKNILNYIVYTSIMIKEGKKLYCWDDNGKQAGKLFDRYGDIFGNSMWGYRFVDIYLTSQFIDKSKIKSIMTEVLNEEKNIRENAHSMDTYSMSELWGWQYLEDEVIKELLENVEKELSQSKYNPIHFKNIICTLMQLEYAGFKTINSNYYKKVITHMKKYLETTPECLKKEQLEIISSDPKTIDKYNSITKPLFDVITKEYEQDRKSINDCFDLESDWGKEFEKICQENKNTYMLDNKFFSYLDVEKIIAKLKSSDVENIYAFIEGIKSIYSFENLYDFFKKDYANLKKFLDEFNVEELSFDKITRKIALEQLQTKLEKSLKLIDKNN